jgi:hypothetical protein
MVAAACGHRRNARVLLKRVGRGVTVALFAEGDEEGGSQDGPSAWQGSQEGEVGMALGALCDGVVEGLDGVQGHTQLADECLHEEGMGGDEAFSGGQWGGALDGADAVVDDLDVAHVMGAEEVLKGGATRALHGCEGGPWGEEVAEHGGVVIVEPLEDMGAGVFEGTGEAIGERHVVADQAAALCDELFEGTPRGALGGAGLEFVARLEQELKLQFGVSGIVLGVAGREGFAVLGQGQRIDGEQDQNCVLTQGLDERAVIAFEAHSHGASVEPLAYGTCPRIDGLWCVRKPHELPFVVADGLSADIVCRVGPIDANEGGKRFFR